MLTRDDFLAEVESFLSATKMAPTAFGRDAVGDPNLIRDLREGRSISLRLVERVSNFIRERSASPQPTPEAESEGAR